MSQRQKDQQAADGQPPAGPNGELQFQPETQILEGKQSAALLVWICAVLLFYFQ